MTLVYSRLDFDSEKYFMNDRCHSVEIIYFPYFLKCYVFVFLFLFGFLMKFVIVCRLTFQMSLYFG